MLNFELRQADQDIRRTRTLLFVTAFIALALVQAVQLVQAAAPQRFALHGPRMDTETGDILVRLGVDVDTTDGLGDMLRDGAIMELTIEARLERVRTLWANATLSEKTLTALLRHNPLTREFSLTMPGDDTYIVDKNLHRLFAATWHKIVFSLGSLTLLQEAAPESAYHYLLAPCRSAPMDGQNLSFLVLGCGGAGQHRHTVYLLKRANAVYAAIMQSFPLRRPEK